MNTQHRNNKENVSFLAVPVGWGGGSFMNVARVYTKFTLGEKSLAAPGSQICVSSALNQSLNRATSLRHPTFFKLSLNFVRHRSLWKYNVLSPKDASTHSTYPRPGTWIVFEVSK